MNNNLTPEQRVNKNGHVVTKHVRVQQASSGSASFPSPSPELPRAHTEAERQENIANLTKVLGIGNFYGQQSEEEMVDRLHTFSDSTLGIIAGTAGWNMIMGQPRYRFMFHVITEMDEQAAREVMFLRPKYIFDVDTNAAIGITKGLHQIERFKDHPRLDELTGVDLDTAVAFLNVTAALDEYIGMDYLERNYTFDDSNDESILIASKDLQDIIVKHYGRAQDIIHFIRERETVEPAAIRDYLESHTAIGNGVL